MNASLDAIVIGGGFAGLSAASALAERGARVLLLEARPTLGGRATAFTDPSTGERVDNGQHILLGCYHETFRFLRRIGSIDRVRVQERLMVDMIDCDGQRSTLEARALRPPLNLLFGLLSWDALGWRDRGAALLMGLAVGRAHSNESVRAWLVRHRQTPRLIAMLWEPLAIAALNQSIDVAAAEPFARVLTAMFGHEPRDSSLALPLVPLDELYALPAKDYIERRGGEVRTNATAKVVIHDGSAERRCSVLVRDETLSARAVVCAVPWYALADTFEGRPAEMAGILDAAARTNSSPIVTVNLWFDRVITDNPLVGLPGRTMQWVFDKRKVFGEQASHLSLVSSGADTVVSRTNEGLIDIALAEVNAAIPASRGAALRRAVVVREKRATFSVAPGQPARPSTRSSVSGLFLAGDWIATGLPATIEGAVQSGHMASDFAGRLLALDRLPDTPGFAFQ